nr:transmembrane protein 161A [Ipomoea batatas]
MLSSLSALVSSSSNFVLQTALAFSLFLLLYFFKIPALFLHGLFTYVHPDDVNPTSSNGARAAIRRPGSVESELKPRKKSKDKFEFDENKAQIFRLKLIDTHLQTRIYFNEFKHAFNSTVVVLSCLLLDRFLGKSGDSGWLGDGSVVPVFLGCFVVCRIFVLIARTAFEGSSSKRMERQLSFLIGIFGFVLGLIIVSGVVPKWILDFDFGSLDGFGKLLVSLFMGCTAGFLYTPALRSARAFWLGTDQIRCNLSIISCGWFAGMLLYANYLMIALTSLLWISPFAELLVNKNFDQKRGSCYGGRVEYATKLVGNVGMMRSDLDKFRLWCLLASGILQIMSLRSNVQMYLNEAVLCWYQRLHSSKVPDLDYSRAKVFLHNHYLCLAVLQFFVPAAMILLLNGLSQTGDNLISSFPWVCSLLPCSVLHKEVALFMAWWVVFVLATFTSSVLALYRHGILYVS